MGQATSYFLVPATGAFCVEPTKDGRAVQTKNFDGRAEQRFEVEPGTGDNIALKHVATGNYLHALGANDASAVVIGDKQWWSLERGKAPNSVWIRNENGAYLCNSYGNHKANNTIYMWQSNLDYWRQTMLWYLQDTTTWKRNKDTPMNLAAAAADAAGVPANKEHEEAQKQKAANLEAREEKIAKSETASKKSEQKQAALVAKEEEIVKRAQELEAQRKDFADQQLQQRTSEQETSQQAQDLEARQKAFKAKQEQLEAREKALSERESKTKNGKQNGKQNGPTQVATLQQLNKELLEQLEEARSQQHSASASEKQVKKLQAQLAQAREQQEFAAAYEDRIEQLETELSTAREQLREAQQQAQAQAQAQSSLPSRQKPSSTVPPPHSFPFTRSSTLRSAPHNPTSSPSNSRTPPPGLRTPADRASVGTRTAPLNMRTEEPLGSNSSSSGRGRLKFSQGSLLNRHSGPGRREWEGWGEDGRLIVGKEFGFMERLI